MAIALALGHDPSGHRTLAGVDNVFNTLVAERNMEEFELDLEVFKPLPGAAKAVRFLEVKGSGVISHDNTLEYVAQVVQGAVRHSLLTLLKNHVFASASTTPLLAWSGTDSWSDRR